MTEHTEGKYQLQTKGFGEEINYYISDARGCQYGEVFTDNEVEAQKWVDMLNGKESINAEMLAALKLMAADIMVGQLFPDIKNLIQKAEGKIDE